MVPLSDGQTPGPNAIARTLGLLGDEWSLLVVRYAFEGVRRYGGWKQHLPISDAVLAARLATLVQAGVLDRRPSGEYALSEHGVSLWPAWSPSGPGSGSTSPGRPTVSRRWCTGPAGASSGR